VAAASLDKSRRHDWDEKFACGLAQNSCRSISFSHYLYLSFLALQLKTNPTCALALHRYQKPLSPGIFSALEGDGMKIKTFIRFSSISVNNVYNSNMILFQYAHSCKLSALD
jgi:hypothetical protein